MAFCLLEDANTGPEDRMCGFSLLWGRIAFSFLNSLSLPLLMLLGILEELELLTVFTNEGIGTIDDSVTNKVVSEHVY